MVDAELRQAMDDNLRQMEILHQEEELEQLELEEAIAQSLAMEQARVTEEIERLEMHTAVEASMAESKDEAKYEIASKEPSPAAAPKPARAPVVVNRAYTEPVNRTAAPAAVSHFYNVTAPVTASLSKGTQ